MSTSPYMVANVSVGIAVISRDDLSLNRGIQVYVRPADLDNERWTVAYSDLDGNPVPHLNEYTARFRSPEDALAYGVYNAISDTQAILRERIEDDGSEPGIIPEWAHEWLYPYVRKTVNWTIEHRGYRVRFTIGMGVIHTAAGGGATRLDSGFRVSIRGPKDPVADSIVSEVYPLPGREEFFPDRRNKIGGYGIVGHVLADDIEDRMMAAADDLIDQIEAAS